jgi:cell division protein YceG involved in septum cleavage
MHPSVKLAVKIAAGIITVLLLFVAAAIYSVYQEKKAIEQAIQNKFDQMPGQQTVKIVKYDSLTQIRIDTIEARRAMSHRHVDNLYSGELQSVLDSLYNTP